ncbi:hypothetical protein EMCG_03134 [[Emmonsia] crescens]|uniref:Ubiquitin 3 binding protein But2 C-terminal domain-containing protein n=1 Tax=[Emmonsia] crescens TaxID=73230 RepID=A0A0G2J8M1_9EURO|nr:hypothetical protein EMCG_03134 [Emmonsia crescens UAMH 3008]
MHFLQATAFLLAALSLQSVSAIPARNPDRIPAECPNARSSCKPGESGVLRVPEMRTISHGKLSPKIGHNIILGKVGERNYNQQMTFHLPQGAKKCSIMWDQGEKRNFIVKNSGLVKIFPTEAGAESIGTADFTNWPQVEGDHSHLVTTVDCEEKLSFNLSLVNDGSVKMRQDATNGWYMEYSC